MRKMLVIVVVAVLAWQGYKSYLGQSKAGDAVTEAPARGPLDLLSAKSDEHSGSFTCNGRVYCSQMTSCSEAKYFLQHCPGVKMDGNSDGTACEKQWCGYK